MMGRIISKCSVHLGKKKKKTKQKTKRKKQNTKKLNQKQKGPFWFYLVKRLHSDWHPGNYGDEWKIPNWWYYRIMWLSSWEWDCVSYANVAIKSLYILVKRQQGVFGDWEAVDLLGWKAAQSWWKIQTTKEGPTLAGKNPADMFEVCRTHSRWCRTFFNEAELFIWAENKWVSHGRGSCYS